MRMKQLQEKLIRSRTSLPPRISSYNKSRIVEDGSSSGTTRNTIRGNNYCSIHFLSTAINFCFLPLIIMNAILYDNINSIASLIVGFNLLLFKIIVYDLFSLFKMGYIQHSPNNKKQLYMMTGIIFVLLLIPCISFFRAQLMVFIAISWSCGYSIVSLLVVSNNVQEIKHIKVLSRVYLGSITLDVILLAVRDVSFYHGKIGTSLALHLAGYILLHFLLIFLLGYGFYFHINNETKIAAAKFDDDKQRRKKKYNNNKNNNV